MSEHSSTTNADVIKDARISPGDDYEEIREQVCSMLPVNTIYLRAITNGGIAELL